MYTLVKGVFTPEQCDAIVATHEAAATDWRPSERKKIKTAAITDPHVLARLDQVAERVNSDLLQMEISGFTDVPALVKYEEGSYFNWHDDTYSGRQGVHRKFSMIVILSKPGSHEGGELQFFDHGIAAMVRPEQGSVFVFPAWMQHQVTKVTKGTRFSIVAFIGGPTKYR